MPSDKAKREISPMRRNDMSGKVEDLSSPAKTAPMSPTSHNITIETRSAGAPRGLFGLTRAKTFFMCFLYLILVGGLVYFILNWLEIPGLNEQLDRLEGEVDKLEQENAKFAKLNEELNDTVQDLKVVNEELSLTADELNITAIELNATVVDLTDEVNQLDKLNTELNTISEFLDGTAVNIDEALGQLQDYLEDQVQAGKASVIDSLESTMRQKVLNWNCNFAAVHGGITDLDSEIPAADWTSIKQYVNENVLEVLCLDEADFVQYFTDTHEVWTSNSLFTAVTVYTQAAMDFYFPETSSGESGLTQEDWSKASFKCKNLETKFIHDAALRN
jgi:hypothetical protein